MKKAAYNVNGGIHPRYHKERTNTSPIEMMPLPELLVVSMSQHLILN